MVIPVFIDIGGPWKVLPPGVHDAKLDDIEARFAISDHRKLLFAGLKRGIDNLSGAGCREILVNGSFVTEKPIPKDYDVCWHPDGVDLAKLDPVFLDFSDNRRRQKSSYYGEYFPSSFLADSTSSFKDFFQVDRDTGKAKGIIRVLL